MRRGAETQFFGSHTNKIDVKGRLATPARFRRALDLGHNNIIYCIPSTDEPCIDCGGAEYIETLMAMIAELDPFSIQRKSLQRTVTARTEQVTMDQEGRVKLSRELREHANLGDKALFAGIGGSFQIWNPETFRQVAAEEEKIAAESKLSLRNPTMLSSIIGGAS